MNFSHILLFKIWDWFVKVTPLQHHFKYQPSYLLAQFAFVFGGIATLIHGNILKRFITTQKKYYFNEQL